MKILFLTYHFPTPDEPGASRPYEEAQLLKELGYAVTVITSGGQYMTGEMTQSRRGCWTEEQIDGISVIKTFSLTNYRDSSFRRLLNYVLHTFILLLASLRISRQDIIISSVDVLTDPILKLPMSYFLAKIKDAYLIVDYRDPYPEVGEVLGYIRPKILVKIINRWQIGFLKRIPHIIAATPGIKKILVDKGVDEGKLTTIPNAFYQWDSLNEPDKLSSYRQTIIPPQEKFTVLCAGGLGQSKKIMTILRAAKVIQEKHMHKIHFIFIGEGEKKNDYIQYCQEKEISNCHFMKPKPKRFLPNIIQRSSAGVYSLPEDDFWSCALSNAIFDYLANGKPVIFAGKGDTAELIQKAGAGIVVEPDNPEALAEAILHLYSNPEMSERMGKNGRHYVLKHYSKEKYLKQFQEVLKSAIKRS